MKLLYRPIPALLAFLFVASRAGAQVVEGVVERVNTSASVRMNCLANLEAVLNIVANSLEVAGILVGTVMLIKAITRRREPGKLWKSLAIATLPIILGLATPGAVNWIVATGRDANLFAEVSFTMTMVMPVA